MQITATRPLVQPHDLHYPLPANHRLFFLHIPKTGGMTLWHVLKQVYQQRQMLNLTRDTRKDVTSHELAPYACFRAHMDYGYFRHFPSKPVYITLLRHPFSHQVSRFAMKKRVGKLEHIGAKDMFDYLERVPVNIQTMYLAGMKNGLTVSEEQALEIALTRLHEMAFVGVIERFRDSLDLASYTFGWPRLTEPPPHNTAKPGDKPELTEALKAAILAKCQLDLKLYEAAYTLFDARVQLMNQHKAAR